MQCSESQWKSFINSAHNDGRVQIFGNGISTQSVVMDSLATAHDYVGLLPDLLQKLHGNICKIQNRFCFVVTRSAVLNNERPTSVQVAICHSWSKSHIVFADIQSGDESEEDNQYQIIVITVNPFNHSMEASAVISAALVSNECHLHHPDVFWNCFGMDWCRGIVRNGKVVLYIPIVSFFPAFNHESVLNCIENSVY